MKLMKRNLERLLKNLKVNLKINGNFKRSTQ
jgi:hypothetical protein